MPALYLPVIVMLLSLVLRGIAFEFRSVLTQDILNVAFHLRLDACRRVSRCSWAGYPRHLVKDGAFAGGPFDWATPFVFLCGLAWWWVTRCSVPPGFMKTEGPVAGRRRTGQNVCLLLVLLFMAAVSLWTPFAYRASPRWFLAAELLSLGPCRW